MLGGRNVLSGVVLALTAASIALVPVPSMAGTTPLDWTQLSSQGPSARESGYLSYDSARAKTVLFGGYEPAGSGTFDSDTWEFDGTTWTQIPASGPPAGALGQMVFDSARGVSVLFGGGNASTFLAPITWEWNGTTWTPRFTTHRPPARVWFGMTYDSTRHVVVLFGGSGVDAGGNHVLFADTWEYDGNDWRQVVTAHSPSGRYGHGLAYDSVRGKTVLFGGHDDTTGRLNDTWQYDAGDWSHVAIANPPYARFQHSMAYVPALGKVVVFGGDYFVPSVTLGPTNETWTFDGSTWQQLMTTNAPSPRTLAPVAYDTANSRLVLFGGSNDTFPDTVTGDTWALVVPESAGTLSASALQFGQRPVLSVTAQDVTLTNTGTAALALSSVAAGGDFSASDNCPRAPATLAPDAACTITVTFTPSSGDVTSSGTLNVTDNAPGGAQSIPLDGSGVWGELHLSSEPLAFGALPINPSGATGKAAETITFPGVATIITGFTADYPFSVNNLDCPIGAQVGNGATCHVQVVFAPMTAGTYSGQVVIRDNEPGLRHAIAVSGTANPIPVAITLNVSSSDPLPTFGRSLNVLATANSPFGTATVTFNGHQLGPFDLGGQGQASVVIPLDDSTIPGGAGTYSLLVSVQPTDGVHSNSSVSQSVTVIPATVQVAWAGTGLSVGGTPDTLAATVSPPELQAQLDFSTNAVWVRFDVVDSAGTVSTYYARVANPGTASVSVTGLNPGAFTVRARLVSALGSALPNAYLTSKNLQAAFGVSPTRGGYVAGGGQQGSTSLGFAFISGRAPAGSLAWVQVVQVTGTDGRQHEAYAIVTSTSVASIASHNHTATIAGQASVTFVDTTTGVRLAGLDQSSAFQVIVAADGSVQVTVNGLSSSLPAGSAVNHL